MTFNAMRHLLPALLLTPLLCAQTNARADTRDAFYWLSEINKASAVMVTEQGIVPPPLGAKIAESVTKVMADTAEAGARRSGDYLQVEQALIAVGGPDVTRLHSGRSRQDIGATSRRLFLRDDMLATLAALNAARASLLKSRWCGRCPSFRFSDIVYGASSS